jgi:hypothetical protein
MPTEIVTAVSVTVAVMSAILALATYMRGGKQVVQGDAAERAETNLKLDFIGNDVKDIKAENRRTASEIQKMRENHTAELGEVRDIAIHAQERADAAHNRMDRAGIDKLN